MVREPGLGWHVYSAMMECGKEAEVVSRILAIGAGPGGCKGQRGLLPTKKMSIRERWGWLFHQSNVLNMLVLVFTSIRA